MVLFTICPLILIKSKFDDSIGILDAQNIIVNIGIQVRITLTLKDENIIGSNSVDIIVVEATAPKIILNNIISSQSINTAQKLYFTGYITSSAICNVIWNTTDVFLDLNKISLTPIIIQTPSNVINYPIYLVLDANTLELQTNY